MFDRLFDLFDYRDVLAFLAGMTCGAWLSALLVLAL